MIEHAHEIPVGEKSTRESRNLTGKKSHRKRTTMES
jgi:hypothetical protein